MTLNAMLCDRVDMCHVMWMQQQQKSYGNRVYRVWSVGMLEPRAHSDGTYPVRGTTSAAAAGRDIFFLKTKS
jgi:hypothetical protein